MKTLVLFMGSVGVAAACLLLVLLPAGTAGNRSSTAQSGIVAGQNFRIYPSSISQSETFITRHPLNQNILFASANTINLSNGFISEGVYVSTDGGLNWRGSDTCNGAPITFHRGDPGIAIDKDGKFLLIRLGFSPGLFAHTSTNMGQTWSAQVQVATNDQDRATLVSDGDAGSLYFGRSYAVWVRFAPPYPVYYSYSTNGGSSWSPSSQINNPPQRCQGGEVSMGPGGRVNICWASVINTSPFTEDYVGFATSTNGGATWSVTENVFDMNGIAGLLPQKANIRVNGLPRIDTDRSGGPRNGWIYVVTTERSLAPAGSDPDIVLHRSADNGATWSSGFRVNQDPVNNGKIQYFPALHVDDQGGVNVLYYDDRSTTSDSSGVYLSRSVDGGTTWTDYPVSDHNFKPIPIGGLGQGYQGDNIGLTSSNNMLWPVWMDNSTGAYQIWTSPIDITTGVTSDNENHASEFNLHQNFPNPFNPQTTIAFDLLDGDRVRLTVYDTNGRTVSALLDEYREMGRHEVLFDGSDIASGTYYYQLRVGEMTKTNAMVLTK
ncbi:MAG TPA: exo-alpha-sialidase [Bacteroidota bacterium]